MKPFTRSATIGNSFQGEWPSPSDQTASRATTWAKSRCLTLDFCTVRFNFRRSDGRARKSLEWRRLGKTILQRRVASLLLLSGFALSTVARSATVRRRAAKLGQSGQASAYEQVASMLLALLILIGVVVFCLFAAWLGMRVFFPPLKSVPVRIEQVGGGMESGFVGESMQLDSPTPQDIAAESDMTEPELQETLKTVLDAVAIHQADLADPTLSDEESTKRGGGQQIGTGNRPGYGFGPGRPGIPPHMRWEISYGDGNTLDLYARQLDFFGIELGVYTTGRVTYAKGLSKPKPDVYQGPSNADKRLYMSWRQGRLKEADRELMAKAGVPVAGKVVLQFYPDATEQNLLHLEHDYKGKDASTIRKTRYGVRPVGKGYEFYVIDQSYL